MHSMGWAQQSNSAQVQALAAGQAGDRPLALGDQGQGLVRAATSTPSRRPGLAAFTLPAYLALDAVGARSVARDAAANARQADHPRWTPPEHPYVNEYGYSPQRAHRVEVRVENRAPIVWALTLVGAVIPAVALLLLVRWVAERIEPGYGTAAAITLGLGTIVMTFAAEYFSHVIAADIRVRGLRRSCSASARARRGPAWSAPPACSPALRSASSTRSASWGRSCSSTRCPTPPARVACGEPALTPPVPRSEPPRRWPSTSGRSDRRFASPTRTRSPSRGSPVTPSWGSTRTASSGSTCHARARRSTCCSPAAGS